LSCNGKTLVRHGDGVTTARNRMNRFPVLAL
jgi:hypothetical protein